jgi:reactive intermediate/imine deaminase
MPATFKPAGDPCSGMRRIVETDDAPAPMGAYSQGTETDDLVFTAGQMAVTPAGDLRTDAPIDVQTRQTLENLEAVLREAGAGLDDVLKTTVYLVDIDDFDAMNEAYAAFFEGEPPARSAVAVDALYGGAGVEIEAVATKE